MRKNTKCGGNCNLETQKTKKEIESVGKIPADALGKDIIHIRPLNAQGGFSSLFKAHKTGLDVDVVIKRVKKVYHGKIDEKSEARIITTLKHQYLPKIYDLKSASDGYVYTVMEYIEGCTLKEYVSQRGALNQKQTLKYVRQLCEVVSYMHTLKPKGIIHSDLKPENIMITPQENICVIDFNASLEIEEEGQELQAIGATMGFAAPEQYNFDLSKISKKHSLYPFIKAAQSYGKVTFRTDVYAIGALAYYMITGYVPKNWLEGVIPLNRYNIILGDAFQSIIEKAMQLKPQKRYANGEEILKALKNMNKFDKRYQKLIRQSRMAAIAVGIGLSCSIFCIFAGVQSYSKNQQSEYIKVIQQAEEYRKKGLYEECEELLTQAIEINNSNAEAYLQLGALLYQQGNYEQAISLLEDSGILGNKMWKKEEFREKEGQIAYILGSCYYRIEEYKKALTNYQLAVEFLPTEIGYQRDLAICYARTGNKKLAEEVLEDMKELGSSQADIAMVQGEMSFAYGEYETAYEYLLMTARGTTDTMVMNRAYIQVAQCCIQLGKEWIDKQIQILEEASGRLGDMNNTMILEKLGESYISKGLLLSGEKQNQCYEQAISYFEQIENRGYGTVATALNKGAVLGYMGKYKEALKILQEVFSTYPNDYRIPMRLAYLCISRENEKQTNSRNYSEVKTYFTQAQQLYQNRNIQDMEMIRLAEIVQQLP